MTLPAAPHAGRERLTFNLGPDTVPGRSFIYANIAAGREPSFATAVHAPPRDWGYFGLLAFTAVLLLRPQDQLPGLTPLHLAEVCAVLGIGPMLIHRLARQRPVFRVTPETVGLLVFGVAILATAPFSIWPSGSIGVFTDMYLKVFVVFVLMTNTLTSRARLEQITWLVLVCTGCVAALSVFDYGRGVNLVEGDRLTGAVGGIFGNPNDLAMNMVTFLPVAVVFAAMRRYRLPRRLAAAGIACLMLATIVFTKSRGGLIGLAAMFVVLLILGQKIRRGFGAAAVVAILVAAPFAPASFWERMSSITDDQKDKQEFTGTRETRSNLMQAGIDTFFERPLTGVGAGQFQNYNPSWRKQQWNETHNALIQVAAETGIVGLLAFTFLIVAAWRAAATTRRLLARPGRRHPDPVQAVFDDSDREWLYGNAVGMTAGLVGWFVCSMFASIAYNWTFYYLLALIVAASQLTRDQVAAGRAWQSQAAGGTVRVRGGTPLTAARGA
jgi:O-antigen ligase